jgi:hypothetical protein
VWLFNYISKDINEVFESVSGKRLRPDINLIMGLLLPIIYRDLTTKSPLPVLAGLDIFPPVME